MSTSAHPAAPSSRDYFGFLHIDLNSFFASVEQQVHPELRGKPVGVTATMADTGTLIAASYEAKAFGIKTGTRVLEARALCKDIHLVASDHSVYADYSRKVAEAVETVCPVAHIASIDEVVCELMGKEREPANARRIALEIKQAIYARAGEALRCSIGMAPNRYLAKIASDMQKPDGLIGLLPSQLPRAIAHLELRDLPGVGARMERRLNAKGITTMEQLLALDRDGVHKLWGSVWGDRLYHWLRGHETGDDGATVTDDVQKSLGHSHVLAPEHRTIDGAWSVAHKLMHKAAMRLRMEHFHAASLAFHIRFALSRDQTTAAKRVKRHTSGIEHESWGMEARFPASNDTLTMLEALKSMWQQCPKGALQQRPFFVGVTLGRLVRDADMQAELFEDPSHRAELSAAMDKLNLKYGHKTLHFAGMLAAKDSAPTRIAFTQIPTQYGKDYM